MENQEISQSVRSRISYESKFKYYTIFTTCYKDLCYARNLTDAYQRYIETHPNCTILGIIDNNTFENGLDIYTDTYVSI